MKYRELLLVILLFGSLCLADIGAKTRRRKPRQRRAAFKTSRKIEFDLCYDFSLQAVASKLSFITLIPRTIPYRQKILSIKYSTEPSRLFSKNENTYAEFDFSKPLRNFQLKINVKAILFRYDLSTARKKQKSPPEHFDPNDFLKHEEFIEKNNPKIQQAAKSIKVPTEIGTVKKLYDYVTSNLKYIRPAEELGAVKTLEKKQGGCTEYSDLFVALCRAKDIPARVVKGYVTEVTDLPQHAWAEVYLQKYGWVPFDLTYGDVKEKSAKNKSFQNLKPVYIYLTSGRNDPVLKEAITVQGFWVGDVTVQESIEFK